MTDPTHGVTEHEYYSSNKIKFIKDPLNKKTEYEYDSAGRLERIDYPNGCYALYVYDDADRLTDLVNHKSASDTISFFHYDYDKVGNRTSMEDKEGTHSYQYDDLYQVTRVDYPDSTFNVYVYDPVGNRDSLITESDTTVYSYDSNNRLLSAGGLDFGYDANGNQVRKEEGSDTTFFMYDKKNRLIGVDFPGDTLVNSFAYNALDQRVKMVDSKGVTNYIYDGAGILMETNQSGQITGAYTNGLMGPISKRNAQNQYGYLMTDALGTVRNIVDVNKDIKMSYKYDIFGSIREAVGTDPIGIPQTFTGKELDTDSGLHYFGARYYDSSLGRFVSADTWNWCPDDERVIHMAGIGALVVGTASARWPGLLNIYVYCANNPLNLVDPSGHFFPWLITLIVAILLVAILIFIVLKKTGTTISYWKEWLKNFLMATIKALSPSVPVDSPLPALGHYAEIGSQTTLYLYFRDSLGYSDEDNPYSPSKSLRIWPDYEPHGVNPDTMLCPEE